MVLERCFAIQSLYVQRAIIAIIDGTIDNCPLYRFFGYMVENKRLTLVFSIIRVYYTRDVSDERNGNAVRSDISESYYSATWGE